MKYLIYTILLCVILFESGAQEQKKNITHYLFPEFLQGTVLMKKGVTQVAMLNYNALTEEMIFENNGVKLALAQLERVDTVFLGGRKFFLQNGKFVELILHSKIDLYAEHKCKINDPGKPSGYGTTSQTGAATTYSTFFSGGRVYEMNLPESIETNAYIIYWIKKDGQLVKFISVRQLLKEFPEKASQIKKYMKDHDVSYDNQSSLVDIIRYIESI